MSTPAAPADTKTTPAAPPPAAPPEVKQDAKADAKADAKVETKPESKQPDAKKPEAKKSERTGLGAAFDEKAPEEKGDSDKPKLELKFPDGADDSFKAEATALAEKLGVDGEVGQKLVDALAERQAETEAKWGEQLDTWQKSLDSDAEVKKSGGVKRALAQATLAMRTVGSPELAKVLADTGFEHHPEVVRAFIRIGRVLGEDTVRGTLSSGGATPKPESLGQLLYGPKKS